MKKRIGLFGGSFNPIHVGHLLLASQLRLTAGLDEVWLMVSPQNPLKKESVDLLDDQLRYQLARIAVHGQQGIVVSNYEMHLPKPSYTWNTLQHLSNDYPSFAFTLLIGGDNWQHFDKWYHAADILSHYDIIVYPRRDSDLSQMPQTSRVTIAKADLLDISSTEIRQRVCRQESIEGLVPPAIIPLVKRLYFGA